MFSDPEVQNAYELSKIRNNKHYQAVVAERDTYKAAIESTIKECCDSASDIFGHGCRCIATDTCYLSQWCPLGKEVGA